MREIKFRAWDEPSKSMIENADIKKAFYFNQPLMQFTGLFDKNGKEIWEGDVVKSSNCFGAVGEVRFIRYYWSACGTGISMSDDEQFGVEVLGNIYNNPELLGSEKEKEV